MNIVGDQQPTQQVQDIADALEDKYQVSYLSSSNQIDVSPLDDDGGFYHGVADVRVSHAEEQHVDDVRQRLAEANIPYREVRFEEGLFAEISVRRVEILL